MKVEVWGDTAKRNSGVEFPVMVLNGGGKVGGINVDITYPTNVITEPACVIDPRLGKECAVGQNNEREPCVADSECNPGGPNTCVPTRVLYFEKVAPGRRRLLVFDMARSPARPIEDGVVAKCNAQIRDGATAGTYPLGATASAVSDLHGNRPASTSSAQSVKVCSGMCCAMSACEDSAADLWLLVAPVLVFWAGRRRRSGGRRLPLWGVIVLATLTSATGAKAGVTTSTNGEWIPLTQGSGASAQTSGGGGSGTSQSWFVSEVVIENGVVRGRLAMTGASFIVVGSFEAPVPGTELQTEGLLTDDEGQVVGTVWATVTQTGLDGWVEGTSGESGLWWWTAPDPESWELLYDLLTGPPTETPTEEAPTSTSTPGPEGSPTETATLTPTKTPTAVPTPTPTGSVEPTPTPAPPSCVFRMFDPIDVTYDHAEDATYPPDEPSCTANPTNLSVADTYSDGSFSTGQLFLRWNTLVAGDWVVTHAALRVKVAEVNNSDQKALRGEWVDWEGTCPTSSANLPDNDALATCGGGCDLSALAELPQGIEIAPSLADPSSQIDLSGTTSLRLYLSDGEPSGPNALTFQAPAGASTGPQLVVKICDPSALPTVTETPSETATEGPTETATDTPSDTPTETTTETPTETPVDTATPTPTLPSCVTSWFAPQVVSLETTSTTYPPASGECTVGDVGDARIERSHEEGSFGVADVLLRWGTETLPDDAVVVDAYFTLDVDSISDADARSLAAGWQPWDGVCDGSAFNLEPGDDAIAYCAAPGCDLATFQPQSNQVVSLRDAPVHIDAAGASNIRLSVSGDEPAGANTLELGDAWGMLAVTWCDPGRFPPAIDSPDPPPLASPTPTILPEPPEGCELVEFPVTEAYFTKAVGLNGSMMPLGCATDLGNDDLVVAGVAAGSAEFTTNLILRWDTLNFPEGRRPIGATLLMHVLSQGAPELGPRDISGDWIQPDEAFCRFEDYGFGLVSALSADGPCGDACDLVNVMAGADHAFELGNVANHLGANGAALRLRVPFGGSESANHLRIASSAGSLPGPRLLVLACEPLPLATPPEGCEAFDLTATEAFSVHGQRTSADPHAAGIACSADDGDDSLLLHRAREWDPSGNGEYTQMASNLLVGFDVSMLPPNLMVAWAALRLPVLSIDVEGYGGASHNIAGGWYPDGECDPDDFAEEPQSSAALSWLSECGDACDLGTLQPGSYQDLALADPATLNLGAPRLRLQIVGSNNNTLRIGNAESTNPPRLVGFACPAPSTETPAATETPTETPADTATPTPTLPPCTMFLFLPQVSSLEATSTSYPPAGGQCSAESTDDARIERSQEQGSFNITDTLIRWDTQDLPDDAIIVDAYFNFSVEEIHDADTRSLAASWQPWDGICDGDTFDLEPGDDAIDHCSPSCELSSFGTGASYGVALRDAAAHIDRFGPSNIRLRISGDEPVGANTLGFAPGMLAVTWCDPARFPPVIVPPGDPPPTPMPFSLPEPDEGCEWFDFPVTEAYFTTAVGSSEGYFASQSGSNEWMMTPMGCATDLGQDDLVVAGITAGQELAANLILRWDALDFPEGLRPVQAGVLVNVLSRGVSESTPAHLWASWIDPDGEFCSSEDYSTDSSSALSAYGPCGEDCDIANVNAGGYWDFELSNPTSHLGSNGAALRLSVPFGGSDVANHLRVSNAASAFGPRLLVLACEPEPLPTPPPGCEAFELTATEAFSVHGQVSSADPEPAGLACSTDDGDDSLLLHTMQDWDPSGSEYTETSSNLILGFDLSTVPANLAVGWAALRLPVLSVDFEGNGAWSHGLEGDWYPGGGCEPEDYTAEVQSTALTWWRECGDACDLGTMYPDSYQDLVLAESTTLQLGTPRLRLRINGSGAVRIGNLESTTPPRLMVIACPVPPTPALPQHEGCENHLIPTVSDGWNAISFDGDPAMCMESLTTDGRHILGAALAAGPDLESPPAIDSKMLLRWSTGDLPADKDITGAWLRLFVGDIWYADNDAALVADWYTWGPACDSGDADPPFSSPAFASCGAACELASMAPYSFVDLPLDDPATHISRGPGANTELRVAMDVGVPTEQNVFLTAVSGATFQGPGLFVQLCEPTPTPSPTSTPTPTPTE